MVVSSYRTPEYQRCLKVDNGCSGSTCGKYTTCPSKNNIFNEALLKNSINVDNCPHVKQKAVDLCVYNTKTDPLTPFRDDGGALFWNKDWIDCEKTGNGKYNVCSCRYAGAITKYLLGTSNNKPNSLNNIPPSDLDRMKKEVKALRKAMTDAGWHTTADPNFEWWHYNWEKESLDESDDKHV